MTPEQGDRGRSGDASDPVDANPALAAALAAHERGVGGPADVLSALAASRLLIPVVEKPTGGTAHLTSVTVTDSEGRVGMLAFTCTDALKRWDVRARPVPVPTRSAAEAALANGAESLVIDTAGPVSFAVDAPGLRSLAAGWRAHGAWPAAGGVESGGEPDEDEPRPRRVASNHSVVTTAKALVVLVRRAAQSRFRPR